MKGLVSIIIPTYNSLNNLKKTIDSLIRQTYTNIEIIIVDDGSEDNTENYCKKLLTEYTYIKYIKQENSGVSCSRNVGLQEALGEYIIFVDSDDITENKFVEQFIVKFNEYPLADMVCCGYSVINDDDNELFRIRLDDLAYDKNNFNEGIEYLQAKKAFNVLWNKCFKAQIIKSNDIAFDVNVKLGEDLLFIIEYINFMKGNMILINNENYKYRISHNGLQSSQTLNNSELRLNQALKVKKIYDKNNYNLNGYYCEFLRIIYINFVFSTSIDKSIKECLDSYYYEELIHYPIKCNFKLKVFYYALKLKNVYIIKFLIKLFKKFKKITKKEYNW